MGFFWILDLDDLELHTLTNLSDFDIFSLQRMYGAFAFSLVLVKLGTFFTKFGSCDMCIETF